MRRVPAGLLKRLERVEQARGACRPYAAFPPILPLDEWEVLAVASQEQLVFLTREHIDIEPVLPQPQQENTQADHERAYREYKKQVDAGPREYLEHKRQQVRRTTATR